MSDTYYHSPESVQQYIQMAEGFDGKELIEELKKILPAKSTLLELGSGPGTDWNILKETYTTTGSDFSKEFLKRLETDNPDGTFIELNAITLKTNEKFDGIYSNKVLHHLTDEELKASVLRQVEILNKEGVICHSFWKGEKSETYEGMLVNYHTAKALTDLFRIGFDILLLEEYAEFEEGDSILLIAKKK